MKSRPYERAHSSLTGELEVSDSGLERVKGPTPVLECVVLAYRKQRTYLVSFGAHRMKLATFASHPCNNVLDSFVAFA